MPFGKPISFFNQVQWQIPYYESVVLFLNMTGNNQSTTILDKSKYGVTFSFNEQAIISSSQSASFPSSLYTRNIGKADGDFIYTRDSENYSFLTQSFTIESWLYVEPEDQSYRGGCFVGQAKLTSDFWAAEYKFEFGEKHYLKIGAVESGTWSVLLYGELNDVVNAGIRKWIHAAISRESFATGSTWRMFIDGRTVPSITLELGDFNGSFPNFDGGDFSSYLYVGSARNLDRAFPGFIDDLIITKGVAKYKENFFPIRYNE